MKPAVKWSLLASVVGLCIFYAGTLYAPATVADAGAENSAPKFPDHYYAMRDGERYGYEAALSVDDQNAGRSLSRVVMFFYHGTKGEGRDKRWQISSVEGNSMIFAECDAVCDFATLTTLTAGVGRTREEVVRVAPQSLLGSVFFDAMRGKLSPSTSKDGSTSWLDRKTGRLITIPAIR
ncbi:hypothetical protein [Limnohabitans sp.]|uniref:hypothetical protein n=1 Tax=Limnohabitans sp. TaxID=1907725 RepID=UPI00286F1E2F|nr:hypothetical protein [Limnohabitans sp.]